MGKEVLRRRRGWARQQSVFWFRLGVLLVGWLLRYWVRCYRAFGVERMPATGGFFVIANHTSALDPFLVGYPLSRRMPHGPGKVELFANPFVGYVMRKLGMFPIKQHVADASAVRAMVELYRAGDVVIVYPEGGRSPSGDLQPFFPDFARLAIRLKASLIPAGLAGARDVLPIGTLLPRPRRAVAVVIGAPFDLAEFYGRELTEEVAEEAATILRERVAEQVLIATRERDRLAERC